MGDQTMRTGIELSTVTRGSMASGKRQLEQYQLSPNLDPDGDNIEQQSLIYNKVKANSLIDITPFYNSTISIIKITIMSTVALSLAFNVWRGTFGCKEIFLTSNYKWIKQIAVLLMIYIGIFVLKAEQETQTLDSIPTWISFVAALLTWLLFNIITNVGDSWLFFNAPFWPGPMTWWGLVMAIAIAVYLLDNQRTYWRENKVEKKREISELNAQYYGNLELILVVIFLIIIKSRFIIELLKARKREKEKFNFINFFFGFNTVGKKKNDTPGECNKDFKKQFEKEIKEGIKNSWWTKIKKTIF